MLPNKVNIAGIEYSVAEVENVIMNGSINYAGSCNYSDSLIEIRSDMVQTKKEQTFVHEVLHAIFNEAGYKEQDEDMINRVSIVLYQVLKQNDLSFAKGENEQCQNKTQ